MPPSFDPISLQRRSLLRAVFLGLGAAAVPAWVREAQAQTAGGAEIAIPSGPLAGIGPVVPQTLTSGAIAGISDDINAPEGFTVRCIARAGVDPVAGRSGGTVWHDNPDGGAVFTAPDGGWVYVSNSEVQTGGGVGAIRFDPTGRITDSYRILTGTRNNCAGGPTPWGTWLSCEETANGEVYECNPFGTAADAVKKPALGAFGHEAAAIDPVNHVCYLTEDATAGKFWRFVTAASDRTVQANGVTRLALTTGTLQVMRIEGVTDGQTAPTASLRTAKRVTWVDVATAPQVPGAPALPQQPPTTTNAGTAFNGGEGVWYYEVPAALRTQPTLGTKATRGLVFFTSKGDNRVYAYDIENALVELIFDNENMQLATGYDDVDNLTVSPAGDVLVCEDGAMKRICVIVPNQPAKLLMQIAPRGDSEIAGAAFTPDGSRLYFSSQRGPSGAAGTGAAGATYELTIPAKFRSGAATPSPAPAPSPAPTQTPASPSPAAIDSGGRFGGGSTSAAVVIGGLAATALRRAVDETFRSP